VLYPPKQASSCWEHTQRGERRRSSAKNSSSVAGRRLAQPFRGVQVESSEPQRLQGRIRGPMRGEALATHRPQAFGGGRAVVSGR
jgi:hypothetical protein